MGQRAALYCRVSTADQSCARQERDLTAFAERAGYTVVATFRETASGTKLDRAERRKVMALADPGQRRVPLRLRGLALQFVVVGHFFRDEPHPMASVRSFIAPAALV